MQTDVVAGSIRAVEVADCSTATATTSRTPVCGPSFPIVGAPRAVRLCGPCQAHKRADSDHHHISVQLYDVCVGVS
jgi:hypothetical protein